MFKYKERENSSENLFTPAKTNMFNGQSTLSPPQRTPEIVGPMIRASENPLVSLNKGRLFKPGYFWGGVRYLDVSVKLGFQWLGSMGL